MLFLDYCNLPVAVSAAACFIAKEVQNNADLLLVARVLRQLAYTLETIAAQREICERKQEEVKNESPK